MSTKKTVAISLVVLWMCFGLGVPSPASAETPKYGGTLVLRVGGEAQGLDPHVESSYASNQLLEHIYSPLLHYDESTAVVPHLAASWDISPDGLVYTFTLRDDVYFHNGRKMTSADVKFSFERMLDPATGATQLSRINMLEKVEAPDDVTVKFHLKETFAPFLGNLAGPTMVIVPPEIVADGSIKTAPVGTGPFMIKERVPGDYVLLEKNPNYFEKGLPYVDYLKLKLITENSAISAAMRSKTIDVTVVWGKLFEFFKNIPGIKLNDLPVFSWAMMQFNASTPPFDNAKLRLALSYAIDRQEIIDSVMLGNAKVTAPIPEAMKGFSADWHTLPGYTVDLEKAKALLAEAGYPDGLTFELKTSTAYPSYVPTCQVIQSNLKKIGVTVEIIPLEWGAYMSDLNSFDTWSACFHSFPSYTADPDAYLYTWFHSQGAWGIGFSDPVVDALLDLGRQIVDPVSRQIVYRRVQYRLAELAPAIYTWRTRVAFAMQPYVKGTVLTPTALYWYTSWLDK